MQVTPSQLIPGCVLLHDVTGKTKRPIIPEQTVLTEEHITVLYKFLVEYVNVSPKLANGEKFTPETQDEVNQQSSGEQTKSYSFKELYKTAVIQYKQFIENLNTYQSPNISRLREALIPVFDTIESFSSNIYSLYQYVSKTRYIYHHSISVSLLSVLLADKLGYKEGEQRQIGLAAVLSDCGLVKFNNKYVMNYEELHQDKQHPVYSYRIIEDIDTLTKLAKLAVLQHHEKPDGSGYPLALTDQHIHNYARIIAVCDTYYSKIREYANKGPMSLFAAIGEVRHEQAIKLDNRIAQVFIKAFVHLYSGAKIKLSTGQTGEIVYLNVNDPAHPMIKLDDSDNIFTLMRQPDPYITDIWHETR